MEQCDRVTYILCSPPCLVKNYSQMCRVLRKSLERVLLILQYPCVFFQKHFNTVFASATVQFPGFCCICVNACASPSSGRWRCKTRKATVVPSCFGRYLKVIEIEQSVNEVCLYNFQIHLYIPYSVIFRTLASMFIFRAATWTFSGGRFFTAKLVFEVRWQS